VNECEKLLVENQKGTLPDASAAALAGAEHPPRLDPVNEVSLLRDAFPYLIFRVPVLELLSEVPAFVRYFYEKFGHAVTGYLPSLYAKSNTVEMAEVANLITLKDLSKRTRPRPRVFNSILAQSTTFLISTRCIHILKSKLLTGPIRLQSFPRQVEA
jgi:hypothetical protein